MGILRLQNRVYRAIRLTPSWVVIWFLIFGGDAIASQLNHPYASANRSPFAQAYGLPAAQSAQLLIPKTSQLRVQLDAANHSTISSSANESIVLDGETHRLNLHWRQGLGNNLELGFDIPYLSHESGRLDTFIDHWHQFFNLPDGIRSYVPKNQLQFSYIDNGTGLIDLQKSTDGIGDISMSLAYQLSNAATRQWALRGGLKLPTGDADSLLGSGSTDVFLGVNVSDQGLSEKYNINLHASFGALWMSSGELLNATRDDWVAYGSSTIAWRFNQRVSFKAQMDFHSAFYNSALTELGDNSAQLVLGAALGLDDDWVLDISVSEDIVVDTAPDVVFQISLTFNGL